MESEILQLITTDRIEIPFSSLDQKLRRARKKNASEIAASGDFTGERVYAFVQDEDKERARGMKEAVTEFEQEFPKYGRILRGKIDEKRVKSETHLYFGMNPDCRLSNQDYMGIMTGLGLSERAAQVFYPELMNISRNLTNKRNEERSVIVGSYK